MWIISYTEPNYAATCMACTDRCTFRTVYMYATSDDVNLFVERERATVQVDIEIIISKIDDKIIVTDSVWRSKQREILEAKAKLQKAIAEVAKLEEEYRVLCLQTDNHI